MAKFTICIAILLVAAANSELTGYPKMKHTIFNDCAKKHGVSKEDMINVYNFDAIKGTAKKCYIYCVFNSYKFLNDDGTIKPEEIEKAIKKEWSKPEDQNKILPVGGDCTKKEIGKAASDKCDYSFNTMSCFVDKLKSVKPGTTWVKYEE